MFYFRCIFYTFYTNTGKMITEIEKTQVRNKLLPHWLFYKVEHEVIDFAYNKMVTDFKNVDEYESLIKQMIRISETIFIKQIAPLDRKDFITVLNDQYNNYNLKCLDMTDWLKTTYKLITEGLPGTQINLQSKSEFLDWYKEKIKSVTPEAPKQTEAVKPKKPKKTLFEFINNINDKEAFLQDLKNTFPTEIGKSIKAIIDLLKKDKYLIHNDREFSDVVNAIKIFFNRDIGSVQSIRDAKNTDDKIFIEPIELKLNPLIIKYKSK